MRAVGLRIDVDTLRGTRKGVPRLLEILARHEVHATFFFTVGPDNMGRHAWRLLNPAFLLKMLRSNAATLYGWDILLAGLFWPGRSIARHCAAEIRAADTSGHEIGLHGWDHHRWQVRSERMSVEDLRHEIALGADALGELIGRPPVCSAVPGWKCNDRVLEAKRSFDFRFNSDCRGRSIFVPVLDSQQTTVQIPTTLPTYDEAIGRNGVTRDNYNEWLLDRAEQSDFNVLTIHAEVEGIACADLFEDFLATGRARGFRFVPLGDLLADSARLHEEPIVSSRVPGRAGTLAVQASAVPGAH